MKKEFKQVHEAACIKCNGHIDYDKYWEDRCTFVENLGMLLAQTDDDVKSCELIRGDNDEEYVLISYIGGGTRKVNVRMDSYAGIIRDVAARFQ